MAFRACSVQEKCGPTGVQCPADDRACQSDAVQRGLEIVCEVQEPGAPAYVYCPAGTQQRDSGIVGCCSSWR